MNDYEEKLFRDRNDSLDFWRGVMIAIPISLLLWGIIIGFLGIIFGWW